MATFEPVNASATIELGQSGRENITVSPTKIVYESDRYNAASSLEVHGIADADDEVVSGFPESEALEVGLLCEINGTLIGSGTLSESIVNEDGIWEGSSFGAVRKLNQNTITRPKKGTFADVVRDIFRAAEIPEGLDDPNVDGIPQYVFHIDDEQEEALGTENRPLELVHYHGDPGFQQEKCVDALDKILRDINWQWWVSAGNVVHVAPNLPSEEYDLQYVLETTAGKQTPPFQQVEVIGDNTPSGDDPAAQTGVSSTEYLISKESPIRATAGDGKPIYTYHDESITSEEQARSAAEAIMEEMLRQQKGGSITIVGNENIQPLDVVTLPDLLGGEAYLVSAVTHDVSNDNGFTTEIACGGLINAGPGGQINEEPVGMDVVINDEGPWYQEADEGSDGSDGSATAGSGAGTVQGPSGGM